MKMKNVLLLLPARRLMWGKGAQLDFVEEVTHTVASDSVLKMITQLRVYY